MNHFHADQRIAEDAFDSYRQENYPKLSRGDAFERFAVAEVSLRKHGVEGSELEQGLSGSTRDGGIDGFYIYLNGDEVIDADSKRLDDGKEASHGLQPGMSIDVKIVQAKAEKKWDTNVFPKIESSLRVILDASATDEKLRSFPLNDILVEKAGVLT